ncbi:hypothetical protein D3C87_1603400 [compost metagenome]
MRAISAGIGASLIIYGASGLSIDTPSKLLNMLGDASYSIYLSHMYIIKVAAKFLPASLLSCAILSITSIVIGYIIYISIERPIQSAFSSKKPKTRPTPPVHSQYTSQE